MRTLPSDPLWYKDAVIYELHVRAFYDDDGDGVGDFKGLTKKLDYLQELGITAIWLLPFYPSPLRDDGYDIADYHGVHPLYGTVRDFEVFLKAAHRRGIRVITELVVNHTSDQHPWFQRARRAPSGSRHRDFYVWNDTPKKYREARIIFKDFESSNWAYDPVAKAYFWHRFYSHQPDLNYENPAVKRAIFQALGFWFGMGVDGMRLDAVPYLYEKQGTDCENLPETHAFLRELRKHVDRKFRDRMLLAEANQWPEDAAAYFGQGDECHMNFHFPLMPRLFMALHMEDRFPVIDILEQTPAVHESAQWALFLRNHDELTLEMVTDEERDYMYRVYAQSRQMRLNLGIRRRLAPLMGNNRRRIELLNALLFSLPGTPVIYYGDELGMGDNVYLGDRNGVRTPMQWSSDRNAGFSRANPQSLYLPVIIDPEYHFESVNVEAQLNNPHSLLWWTKRLIAHRKRTKAFGCGSIEFLYPENRKVLAFVRRYGSEAVLVVANLSRHSQYAALDLSRFKNLAPVELWGRTEFPPIVETPYLLSLGPHSFYWFSIEEPRVSEVVSEERLRVLVVSRRWESVLEGRNRERLEEILSGYVRDRRWFGGKANRIDEVEIVEAVPIAADDERIIISLIRVSYTDAEPELYLLPLAFVTGMAAEELIKNSPHAVIARLELQLRGAVREGAIIDAVYDPRLAHSLLAMMERRRQSPGERGTLKGGREAPLKRLRSGLVPPLEVHLSAAEQTNTSFLISDRLIMKLYRRLQEGINPDLEVGRFLSVRAGFMNTPPVAGHLTYERRRESPMTLGIVHGYVPNEGDAWQFTLDQVEHYLEGAVSRYAGLTEMPEPRETLMQLAGAETPELATEVIGVYVESARLLGQRTAELHLALASDDEDPDFAPEPFTPFYWRSLYQSMRNLTGHTFQLLRRRMGSLAERTREEARSVVGREDEILAWFQAVTRRRYAALRMRVHGDYHLGQVLYTGKDFVIIDFEGEPARGLEERRLKRSPLRDVAGMIRSFHYAAYTALLGRVSQRFQSQEEGRVLQQWTQIWYGWVAATYLRAYLQAAERGPLFEGASREVIGTLLDLFLLEKAVYELGYELNNRPDWIRIPLRGILEILGRSAGAE